MVSTTSLLAVCAAALAAASPIAHRRAVDKLNEEATKEAHQRDDTATRAFSNVRIKTSDGRCLFVDQLSGDFRANLTPVQIADCGSTDGQGWDIITSGKHNDQEGKILVVSTLTQACLNFDPRRQQGQQLNLFSCGGRADGGGRVTDSQLFSVNGGAGSLSLTPANSQNTCLTGMGQTVGVANCNGRSAEQAFVFCNGGGNGNGNGNENDNGNGDENGNGNGNENDNGINDGNQGGNGEGNGNGNGNGNEMNDGNQGGNGGGNGNDNEMNDGNQGGNGGGNGNGKPGATRPPGDIENVVTATAAPVTTPVTTPASNDQTSAAPVTSATPGASTSAALTPSPTPSASTSTNQPQTTAAPASGLPTVNPTTPVPVSRAGGTLDPSAAAEAHKFDSTAVRTKASVNIRAADGRCLSVDPTAGDFRQNLIPVAMVECADVTSQKFDIVTSGLHNNRKGRALLVSVMTDGCLSFDPRRERGDTVTMFSCGGRADGSGQTDSAQLFPFDGSNKMVLAPRSGRGRSCLVPGAERLDSARCDRSDKQAYEIVEVL